MLPQPATTDVKPPSHPNIPPFFTENKRPPASHPFPPFYNGTGMKLSSIHPPTHAKRKIPIEPTIPPNPYQIQPLTQSDHEPFTFPYNERCP